MKNQDKNTVEGFGDEWSRFDQSDLPEDEQKLLFDEYFSVFPWENISKESVGFDLGCGSGRWAKSVAPKVKKLICIDPSSALDIAKKNLSNFDNCESIGLSSSVFFSYSPSLIFSFSTFSINI